MDELDFLELLPNSGYVDGRDRYNEFRRLFMGSDEGKRVLREILAWGYLFAPPNLGNPVDSNLNLMVTGQMNIVRKLLKVVNIEPPERPEQTTNTQRKSNV